MMPLFCSATTSSLPELASSVSFFRSMEGMSTTPTGMPFSSSCFAAATASCTPRPLDTMVVLSLALSLTV